jgi:hypothetical protein
VSIPSIEPLDNRTLDREVRDVIKENIDLIANEWDRLNPPRANPLKKKSKKKKSKIKK